GAGALYRGFGGGGFGLAGRCAFEGVGQGPQVGAGAGLDDVGGDAGAGGESAVGPQLDGHLAEGVVAAGDSLDGVFDELALDPGRRANRAEDGVDRAVALGGLADDLLAGGQDDADLGGRLLAARGGDLEGGQLVGV